jgi:hypothetical protein
VSLTVFSDGCDPGVELVVELGLMTPSTFSGIWDLSLWDIGRWGSGPDRVDVSDYVRAVETNRSFGTEMKTWTASSVTITLSDLDGRFSPDNLEPGAPYVVAGLSGIRPGCMIWISMIYAGISYAIYTGYVTDLNEDWKLHGISQISCSDDPENLERLGDAITEMVGTDEWGRLGRQKKQMAISPIGAGDDFGTRVARILSAAGYTGSMLLESGTTTLQATDLSSEPLSELNKVAESEGGAIWVEADGSIVAKGRYSLMQDPRSSIVQIAFGDNDAAGETMWANISVAPVTDQKIINHTIYARTGGTPQEYKDAISISLYGVCDDDDQPTDLLNETDVQVASLAQWKVIIGANPESPVQSLTLKPRCDLPTLAPMVLSTKIRDLVSVRLRPPSDQHHYMYRECFISGIRHTIEENDWTVEFSLSTATAYRLFVNSKWDSGTWGASDVDITGALWFA